MSYKPLLTKASIRSEYEKKCGCIDTSTCHFISSWQSYFGIPRILPDGYTCHKMEPRCVSILSRLYAMDIWEPKWEAELFIWMTKRTCSKQVQLGHPLHKRPMPFLALWHTLGRHWVNKMQPCLPHTSRGAPPSLLSFKSSYLPVFALSGVLPIQLVIYFFL